MTKRATIRPTRHPSIKKASDRSMKKSGKKPAILSTPDVSTKKPTKKKAPKNCTAAPPPPRSLFVPRTSGHGKGGVRPCKYCKRSFYYADLPKHGICCYASTLDKEELALIEDEDDGKVCWLQGGYEESTAASLAKQGLQHLNKMGDKQYKIVRPGPFKRTRISRCLIVHFNFKAKANDTDLVETFFCQLRVLCRFGRQGDDDPCEVDVLTSLGPSDDQKPWNKPSLRGCKYCHTAVHHPVGKLERLLKGRKDDDDVWLYGEKLLTAEDYAALERQQLPLK